MKIPNLIYTSRLCDVFTALFLGFLLTASAIGQNLTGSITDPSGQKLPGVNIQVLDSHLGGTTDSLGSYNLTQLPPGDLELRFSAIGFLPQTRKVSLPATRVLDIQLKPTLIQLSEITVSGTMVTDVSTPVSSSSLSAREIQTKHHLEDVPLLLNMEPGVYVTNDNGSGMGSSRIWIRGFDEKRIQVLVNNIPVNDPETKEVSWAQWSTLPDVAQAIQVQRGVGTGLYGSGAIGGAINIVTLDAKPQRAFGSNLVLGADQTFRAGIQFESGQLPRGRSYSMRLGLGQGTGWRENSYAASLYYYVAATQRLGTTHLFKLALHGAPQIQTLANAAMSAASYARAQDFSSDSLRMNDYGQFAFGFGSDFNGNVHVAADDLNTMDSKRGTSLLDALFFRSRIGLSPQDQVGGFIIANGRASLNNNISHRPQLELHHSWYLNTRSKLTSTMFMSSGMDYSDDVYPAWFIPRQADGRYEYAQLYRKDYWGADQVFEYRYYSDFTQLGILSSLAHEMGSHQISLGVEARNWSARHAGEVLNLFGADLVGVPIGSIVHPLGAGDLFYDFITDKPQASLFGHGLWRWGRWQLMTNLQITAMRFRVREQIPSNNNYPDHLDEQARETHGGPRWTGTATWDDDGDALTAEVPVTYSLWDYEKSFQYITPRLGLSYALTPDLSLYANLSQGIKEPEIKHFYGYGAPQDELDLEQTVDFELGMNWNHSRGMLPFHVGLTYYRIDFAGKLMQITLPEKANTPGYDYAGHTYVPVGDAQYSGFEGDAGIQFPGGFRYDCSLSLSRNVWGEPLDSEGAQKLYANEALANVDYEDANGNGVWDEGGSEPALHRHFVDSYGPRYDVGMPQVIVNQHLQYSRRTLNASISLRYFKDIFVLENNADILVGPGSDRLYFTSDDVYAPTLPAALITDIGLSYTFPSGAPQMEVSATLKNLFAAEYWQRGDEYGVIPGAARTWLVELKWHAGQ